jgi:hypothetical protein
MKNCKSNRCTPYFYNFYVQAYIPDTQLVDATPHRTILKIKHLPQNYTSSYLLHEDYTSLSSSNVVYFAPILNSYDPKSSWLPVSLLLNNIY